MIASNQRINEPIPTKTASCNHRKGYGMTVIFVVWLAYSVCALGWFILEAPSGVHCTNQVN